MQRPKPARIFLACFALWLFAGCAEKEPAPEMDGEFVFEKEPEALRISRRASLNQEPNPAFARNATQSERRSDQPATPPAAAAKLPEPKQPATPPAAAAKLPEPKQPATPSAAARIAPKAVQFPSRIKQTEFVYLDEGGVALALDLSMENPGEVPLELNKARFTVWVGSLSESVEREFSGVVPPGKRGSLLFPAMPLFKSNPLGQAVPEVRVEAVIEGRGVSSSASAAYKPRLPEVEVTLSGDGGENFFLRLTQKIRVSNPNPFSISFPGFEVRGSAGSAEIARAVYDDRKTVPPGGNLEFEKTHRVDMLKIFPDALGVLYQSPFEAKLESRFVFPFFAVDRNVAKTIRLKPFLRTFPAPANFHEADSD